MVVVVVVVVLVILLRLLRFLLRCLRLLIVIVSSLMILLRLGITISDRILFYFMKFDKKIPIPDYFDHFGSSGADFGHLADYLGCYFYNCRK